MTATWPRLVLATPKALLALWQSELTWASKLALVTGEGWTTRTVPPFLDELPQAARARQASAARMGTIPLRMIGGSYRQAPLSTFGSCSRSRRPVQTLGPVRARLSW